MGGPSLLLGTVRSRKGSEYLVVTSSGERVAMSFEDADRLPSIGADVIGIAEIVDGRGRMRLVEDITGTLLQGRTLIASGGRPEVTARMLARILAKAGPGIVGPGIGGIIDRSASTNDADVGFAYGLLAPEARRLGIALNVVDPASVAGMDWAGRAVVDELLPADVSGEQSALADMRRIFLSGMTPCCRRTVERLGKGRSVPSVDFVVPYSPFETGLTWSQAVAGATKDEIVKVPMDARGSRRFSSLREMSKAFVPRYMARSFKDADVARQAEECFADVSATLAMLATGDDTDKASVFVMRRLREARLSRWNGRGEWPVASSVAMGDAISSFVEGDRPSAHSILATASEIALANIPVSRDDILSSRTGASGDFFHVARAMSQAQIRSMESFLERDVAVSMSFLATHAAVERFDRHAATGLPFCLADAYDRIMDPVRGGIDYGATFEDEGMMLGNESALPSGLSF